MRDVLRSPSGLPVILDIGLYVMPCTAASFSRARCFLCIVGHWNTFAAVPEWAPILARLAAQLAAPAPTDAHATTPQQPPAFTLTVATPALAPTASPPATTTVFRTWRDFLPFLEPPSAVALSAAAAELISAPANIAPNSAAVEPRRAPTPLVAAAAPPQQQSQDEKPHEQLQAMKDQAPHDAPSECIHDARPQLPTPPAVPGAKPPQGPALTPRQQPSDETRSRLVVDDDDEDEDDNDKQKDDESDVEEGIDNDARPAGENALHDEGKPMPHPGVSPPAQDMLRRITRSMARAKI